MWSILLVLHSWICKKLFMRVIPLIVQRRSEQPLLCGEWGQGSLWGRRDSNQDLPLLSLWSPCPSSSPRQSPSLFPWKQGRWAFFGAPAAWEGHSELASDSAIKCKWHGRLCGQWKEGRGAAAEERPEHPGACGGRGARRSQGQQWVMKQRHLRSCLRGPPGGTKFNSRV